MIKLLETKTLPAGYTIKPAKSVRINGTDRNQAHEAAFRLSAYHGKTMYVVVTGFGYRIVCDSTELLSGFFAINAATRTAELYG